VQAPTAIGRPAGSQRPGRTHRRRSRFDRPWSNQDRVWGHRLPAAL